MIPRLFDSLSINGTPIEGFGVMVTDYSGLFAPGTRRGDDDVIPGRRGQVGAELPYDAYVFSIPVTFANERDPVWTPHDFRIVSLQALASMGAYLAGNNGLVTLTRTLSAQVGVGGEYEAGIVEHTAAGRYIGGTAVTFLNPYNWTTELQFINLDGAWFDGEDWLVP